MAENSFDIVSKVEAFWRRLSRQPKS